MNYKINYKKILKKENIYNNYLKIFIVKNNKFKFALKKIYNQ